jgi:hypothetical protein
VPLFFWLERNKKMITKKGIVLSMVLLSIGCISGLFYDNDTNRLLCLIVLLLFGLLLKVNSKEK